MAKSKKKQEAEDLEKIERAARVVELRKSGASYRQIAQILREKGEADVSYQTVRRDCKEALEVLRRHRLEETEDYFERNLQSLEGVMLANWQYATGRIEKVINKKTGQAEIDPQTNKEIVKHLPPSVPHGRLFLAAVIEINEMFGFKAAQKHEISGKGGKPIETVSITVDQWRKEVQKRREQAAKTAEIFNENE